MHSAKEDQPCLLLFNEFRKDEGSKIDKNRCKPELLLAALARCGAIIALRCSVLALIALSTTTFGCYWDLLGDSGLVIDWGLVRLSVSPCNLRNLSKSWHRSASKQQTAWAEHQQKGLGFFDFLGCCSISSWVLQIKELIEEDANRRCKIPPAFQRGTVGNTTAVLVMSPNQEPGPGDSDWDRRCKSFQLLTCQLKRQICAPTSSATFKMRLEFRVPATEPYKIWMMVPSILIVWRPIDEDGPNDHCVSGGNQQPEMALWLVFLRKLDS